MSEVMNVRGDECRGDECRTIVLARFFRYGAGGGGAGIMYSRS